jgi:hypothetical protein
MDRYEQRALSWRKFAIYRLPTDRCISIFSASTTAAYKIIPSTLSTIIRPYEGVLLRISCQQQIAQPAVLAVITAYREARPIPVRQRAFGGLMVGPAGLASHLPRSART